MKLTAKMFEEGELAVRKLSAKAQGYYANDDSIHLIVVHPDDEYFPMYAFPTNRTNDDDATYFDSLNEVECYLEELAEAVEDIRNGKFFGDR